MDASRIAGYATPARCAVGRRAYLEARADAGIEPWQTSAGLRGKLSPLTAVERRGGENERL
jgi:hypothetical protein